jgi:hypothetical protein
VHGEQIGFTSYGTGGIFGWPEKNRLKYNDPETNSKIEGVEKNIFGSPWSSDFEDQQMHVAVAE